MDYLKVPQEINNIVGDNVKLLAQLFPSAVKDGQVDFEALKEELGQFEEVDKEKYELTWAGKQDAKKKAQEDVYNRTLNYIESDSKNPEVTENLYIEGDNLEVLKLLRQNYYGAIKMIYIDPPYNTGKNYIYRNDFTAKEKEYLEQIGELDLDGGKLTANLQTSGRFHSNWLSMMYPRLRIAKDFLSKEGVLVVAIDENEQATLSIMLRDIFPESSYEQACVTVVHNPRGQQGTNISYVNEYLFFIFPNDGDKYIADFPKDEVDSRTLRDSGTESDRTDARSCFYPFYVKDNKIIRIGDVPADSIHPTSCNVTQADGSVEVWPMTDDGDEKKWRYARQSVESIIEKLEPKMGRNNIQIIFNKDQGTMRSVWSNARYDSSEYGTKLLDKLIGGAPFTFPKSLYAVYDCVKATTQSDKDAIVMDFFSGSATTAHAVMLLNSEDGGNRKNIMVQLPENLDEALLRGGDAKTKTQIETAIKFLDNLKKPHTLCEIGKERIHRAGEQIKEEIEAVNAQLKIGEKPKQVPDIGFKVFRTADTNIKWNLYDTLGQLDTSAMTHTPDLADFTMGFNDIDVVYEVMLRQKDVPLSSTLETLTDIGSRTYLYGSAYLVCLETDITEELIDKLAALDPLPIRFIFRDSAFKDDINLKDETFRRLKNLIERNSGLEKKSYTVEFI